MITAIITQLKTGSVSTVIARSDGDNIANPDEPYVVVWEADRVQTGNGQAVGGFFVAYHNVPGSLDSVNAYMENEIVTLLHKITLQDSLGNYFRLLDSNELSTIIDTNDDGTISKDRLFVLPKMGVV